jgi:hypothetical protein
MKNPEKFKAFDGKRFVVRADEKLTVFLELESAIHRQLELGWSAVSESSLRVFEIGAVFSWCLGMALLRVFFS